MGKDHVDAKAAQALAWTYAATPERLRKALGEAAPHTDDGPPPPPTPAERAARIAQARERSAQLEAELEDRAAALEAKLDALEQRAFEPADLMDLIDAALAEPSCLRDLDDELAFRLASFLLAHRGQLDEGQRDRAAEAAGLCIDVEDSAFESWVLAVVRSGDGAFCQAVGDFCLDMGLDQPLSGLPQRLGDVLETTLEDRAVGVDGHYLALRCLDASEWPVNRAAVAPFLTHVDWHLRILAVALLGDSEQLTAADLFGLLRDASAADADLPVWYDMDATLDLDAFHERLSQALRALRPPEVLPLLQELTAARRSSRDLFSPHWAMKMLAELDAARALPEIDLFLRCFDANARAVAREGLAVLPWPLARPRVERLCNDPVPTLARTAQDLYLERARTLAPVDPLGVLPPGRLQQPPSEVLLRRLAIARTPAAEGRLKLRDLLVTLAREGRATAEDTLVLVTLFCDEAMLADPPTVRGFYDKTACWLAHLRPLLGVELELAVVAMAERYSEGRSPVLEWIIDLHGVTPLCPEALTRARVLAHARYEADAEGGRFSAERILSGLGAAPERWEGLYAQALLPDGEHLFNALVRCGPQAALDARLEHDAAALPDGVARARALHLGLQRGQKQLVPEALALLQRVQVPEHVQGSVSLMRTLIGMEALAPSALRGELADVHHPRFLLGYHALRDLAAQDAGVAAALTQALAGPSEVAFLALYTLLSEKLLPPDDARLRAALDRLELEDKSTALYLLLSHGADPQALAGHLLDVLCHGNEDDRSSVEPYLEKSSFGRALMAQSARAPARA